MNKEKRKYKGVTWDKRSEKWISRIFVNGENKNLGSFKTYEEAVSARKEAEIEYGFVPVMPPLNLKHKNDLTQQMLKKLLHYDPNTGLFTWKVKTAYKINIGDVAGSLKNHGYIHIRIGNKIYLAHRLAFLYMTGEFPEAGLEVDHINHKPSDNSWVNLRKVTHSDNQRNRTINKNNKAGCTGVSWDQSREQWRSRIYPNGKSEHLGLFETKEEAIAARKQAELKYNYHENHGNQFNRGNI